MDGRNALLAEMTDDVAALVLRNNYLQPLALSLAERRGMEAFGFQQRLIQTLEKRGHLDRAVEFLPDDAQLAERRRRAEPFTRPELSVLLAYAKLTLDEDLLESTVPDDPYLARELGRYFPKAIAERFPDALEHHRLRREIIATQLGNSMINRGGPSLIVRIADQTGAAPAAIAAAFAAVRDSFGMTALNTAIDGLDNIVSGKLQLELYAAVQDLLLDRIIWFLRNVDLSKGLAEVVAHYRDGIAAVEAALDGALSEESLSARTARKTKLVEAGVPEELAGRLSNLPSLTAAPDIVLVADRTGKPIGEVAATYFAGERVLPARSHHQRREHYSDCGLFRPAGARPGAGFDRGSRATACRSHGRRRRGRRCRGRGLGGAAPRRGRARSAGGSRDRQFRADAVETRRWPQACSATWSRIEGRQGLTHRRRGPPQKRTPSRVRAWGSRCCLNLGLLGRAAGCRGDGGAARLA